jgi:AraC family transcriptional regulator, transcriptional activator of pobA
MPYARYDFYKIMLIRGRHRCHYADKSIEFDGCTLLFSILRYLTVLNDWM